MRYALLSVMAVAVASASASLVYPISFPIERRQEPGSPEYDCHANCGGVIVAGRTEGYCDTANFTTQLDACLDCALEFDIWQYYGDSVAEAATACGLDATPVAANATSETTSSTIPEATPSASPSSSPDGAEVTSSTPTTASSAETTSAMAEPTISETPSDTSSAEAAAETGNFGNRIALGGQVALPLVALIPALL
ncbi:hypothetical protein PV04_05451 [Phialophora macrospora]|uniref:Extracellular membrane protein CFEM domain-containing protein n=1 Tax=Phialophora macrospora TaxID=1851006 RepID=A0A0D2CWN7_9EURO|nr:hypothetical protein PV04_05451 [Phialophora macrospora]